MKKIIASIFLCFWLETCNTLSAQTLSDKLHAEIEEYMTGLVSGEVPGIALGIVWNGKTVFEGYYGYASLQHKVKVDSSTRFNIASVAKQFTALCVLNLSMEKRINLDDDIRTYLPSLYPELEEELKIRYIINHSSGIRDFYDLMSLQNNPWWRVEGLDNDEAMILLEKQKELNFKPNTNYLYSNSNYIILTRLVEKVTGKSFSEYAKELFLGWGMLETHYLENYMYIIPNLALPYSDWGDGVWQQYPMITNLHGDGFLFTTLNDQLLFEKQIQRATETNQLLTASQKPVQGTKIQTYGYGLEFNKINGYSSVNHSGGTGSYHAQTIRFPEQQLSIVVMSNNGNLWSGFITSKVASVILPEKEPIDPSAYYPTEEDLRVDSRKISGEYVSPDNDIVRIHRDDDGELYWKNANNNPRKINKINASLYEWESDKKLKLFFDTKNDEVANFTVYYPNSEPRVHKKLKSFVFTNDYLSQFVGRYVSPELEFGFNIELENNQLLYKRDNSDELLPIENIQKDHFLLYDYIIKPDRSSGNKISALLITINRVKNVRFDKI